MIERSAIALLLTAETLAFYTFGELAMRVLPEPHNEVVSAPGFIAIGFVAFLAPAVIGWLGVGGVKQALVVGLVGLLVIYSALRLQYAHELALWDFSWGVDFVLDTGKVKDWVPSVLASSFFLVMTWAWASWRSRSGIWLENAPRSLAIPFLLVTLALLLTAASEGAVLVTRGGVVFYGVALAALAFSQLSQSGTNIGGLRAGGVTTLMLLGTGTFAILGVLLVGVFLEPLIDVLSTPVSAIAKAIAWFITWTIFFPLAWVLTHLVELLLGWLGRGDSDSAAFELPEMLVSPEGAEGNGDESESLASRVTRFTLAGGAIVFGIAVVGALIFILALIRRRSSDPEINAPEAERVGSLGEDLRGFARNLFRRDHRRKPLGEGVVRLYLDVLASSSDAGKPRSDGQTSQEFAPVLLSTFNLEVTDEITSAFENARYADRVPQEAMLEDLRRRWGQRG
ncbi:MAG: hypothetical protein CL897_04900 [Dehalococcoidia bacterium]|nr:hypothetical protein [Dehalococcoidia bacterium]